MGGGSERPLAAAVSSQGNTSMTWAGVFGGCRGAGARSSHWNDVVFDSQRQNVLTHANGFKNLAMGGETAPARTCGCPGPGACGRRTLIYFIKPRANVAPRPPLDRPPWPLQKTVKRRGGSGRRRPQRSPAQHTAGVGHRPQRSASRYAELLTASTAQPASLLGGRKHAKAAVSNAGRMRSNTARAVAPAPPARAHAT